MMRAVESKTPQEIKVGSVPMKPRNAQNYADGARLSVFDQITDFHLRPPTKKAKDFYVRHYST